MKVQTCPASSFRLGTFRRHTAGGHGHFRLDCDLKYLARNYCYLETFGCRFLKEILKDCFVLRLRVAEAGNTNVCYLVTFRLLLNEPARVKSKLNNSEIIVRGDCQHSRKN